MIILSLSPPKGQMNQSLAFSWLPKMHAVVLISNKTAYHLLVLLDLKALVAQKQYSWIGVWYQSALEPILRQTRQLRNVSCYRIIWVQSSPKDGGVMFAKNATSSKLYTRPFYSTFWSTVMNFFPINLSQENNTLTSCFNCDC